MSLIERILPPYFPRTTPAQRQMVADAKKTNADIRVHNQASIILMEALARVLNDNDHEKFRQCTYYPFVIGRHVYGSGNSNLFAQMIQSVFYSSTTDAMSTAEMHTKRREVVSNFARLTIEETMCLRLALTSRGQHVYYHRDKFGATWEEQTKLMQDEAQFMTETYLSVWQEHDALAIYAELDKYLAPHEISSLCVEYFGSTSTIYELSRQHFYNLGLDNLSPKSLISESEECTQRLQTRPQHLEIQIRTYTEGQVICWCIMRHNQMSLPYKELLDEPNVEQIVEDRLRTLTKHLKADFAQAKKQLHINSPDHSADEIRYRFDTCCPSHLRESDRHLMLRVYEGGDFFNADKRIDLFLPELISAFKPDIYSIRVDCSDIQNRDQMEKAKVKSS